MIWPAGTFAALDATVPEIAVNDGPLMQVALELSLA
jgi:hypothetical protein